MQEYRINYTLLIGLIVGTLVCSGAIYGVHQFQLSRQSGWLISEAERASAEKNYSDAAQYYQQYISIDNDDLEVKIKLANTLLDLVEQDNVDLDYLPSSIQTLETIVRNPKLATVPETKNVRRRLVAFYGQDNIRNYNGALDHLKLLLDSDPNNVELLVLRATYLAKSGNVDDARDYSYKLIGYDPKKDDFDEKKATAPKAVEVYANLAALLRAKSNKPELAERVLNQMVKINPKDAAAYVSRGRLLAAWGSTDGARGDAQKAYQLKPEDTDVLLLATDVAAQDKKFDKAHEFLKAAKKLHPKEPRIYQRAASLEMQDGKVDKALAELDAGAKAIGGGAATNILFVKARLQIEANDLKGARQTIEDMQQTRKLVPEVSDYFDALFLVAEGKWYPAVEALSKLRPRMAPFGKDMATEIDFDLALCYERLARCEQAKQYYDLIVQQNPQNAPAVAGAQRMRAALGMQKKESTTSSSGSDPLQAMIVEIMQQPKDKQDWSKLDAEIDKIAKERKLTPQVVALLKAQIAMMREDYPLAAKLVLDIEKTDPKNLQIKRFKLQLARLNPKIGPAKALEYWQRLVDEFGDQPGLRLDKADILMSLQKDKQDKEQLKQDLASLAAGIDKWTTAQKVELWNGIARDYINLNMIDEARQYLNLVADNQPQELPVRLALFSMALEANDADGMKSAQDKILQVVGDQNDSAWLYAEARRKIWLMRRNQVGAEALPEVRSLVKRALDQRAGWSDLYALLAEVELLSNNAALALKNYDRAEELGRPAPTAVAAHIKLLALNGRYADAGKLLDRIPEPVRQPLLGPLYAEILFQSKQVDAAIQQAKAATVADPNSAQNQYWYSQLLARSSQDPKLPEASRKESMAQATLAMQKATQLQPEFAEAWFALINYLMMQDRENEAQKAMRDAQLAMSGDNLTNFLARTYESLHRWFDAETMYREIYETKPDDLGRAQQLAAFYMGPLYQRPDRKEKATPLINQLLKAGADGKLAASDSNLLWARRMAAKMLAATGDYQNSLKAEKLLLSNSRESGMLIDDKLALAEILAPRPEPDSRKKAIGHLEEIDRIQPLNESAAIQLAELYYATRSEWSKYESQMEKVIARYPNSAKAYDSYARKLLMRGDAGSIDRAIGLVVQLQKIAPTYPGTFDLTVRIAGKRGKQKEAAEQLRRRLPNLDDPKELDPAAKQTAAMIANLLVDVKDYDGAEKIYRSLAARDPNLVLQLTEFVGLRRSPEQCFEKLNELYKPEKVPDILRIAMSVARERRDKVGDKFDAQIQRWIDAGLRENPDAITLLIVQGDFFDLQKKYDEAEKVYRKLLDRKELTGIQRAIVLNNLAFLVALAGKSASAEVDATKLVAEAVEILGPNPDILDTRAVVLISLGKQLETAGKDKEALAKYKDAIADLELSVTDNPTASKYFHLVQAHLGAKESRAAVEAWEKAEGLGLTRESLNRMEFDQFEKVKSQIEKFRGTSVSKSDPIRKAG